MIVYERKWPICDIMVVAKEQLVAAASLRQTKMTVLLSVNAAAIFVAGVLIAGAIMLNGGMNLRIVEERSDDTAEAVEAPEMIEAESNSKANLTEEQKKYVTSVPTV